MALRPATKMKSKEPDNRNAARSGPPAQEARGALLAPGRPADQEIVRDARTRRGSGRTDQEGAPDRSGVDLRLGGLRQHAHRRRPGSGARGKPKARERKTDPYLSQLLHLNAGVSAPGSIITDVISPQRPHWRDSLVGSLVTGLVAPAIAASACARSSALLRGGPRRCAMRACLTGMARQINRSRAPEEIALADLDAAVAQDVVGGGGVEIEVRQREADADTARPSASSSAAGRSGR